MRKLQIKFPSQIRISGWDFGSSARAMNQAGGKDSLMTYLRVIFGSFFAQAELAKYARSTFERKTMSSTIKRIALVAVAALAFGSFSDSAHAADNAILKYATGDGAAASPYNTGNGIAGPANTVTLTYVQDTAKKGYVTISGASATIASGGTVATSGLATLLPTGSSTTSVVINTPATGTITANVYQETASGSGIFSTTAAETVTITVNAAAQNNVYSASTVYGYSGDTSTVAAATSTTDAAWSVTAEATASNTAQAALISVVQKDALGNALTSGWKAITVSTTVGTLQTTYDTNAGSYVSVTPSSSSAVGFWLVPSGQTGTGTVTVAVNGVTVKTYSVNFFSNTVKSLEVSAKNANVAAAAVTGYTAAGKVVKVIAKDVNGNAIPSLTNLTATSSDTAIATVGTPAYDSTDKVYYVPVTGVAAGSVTVTVKDSTATYSGTATVNITKAVASAVTLSLPAYTAGELTTATLSATDSNGKPVADGTYTAFLSAKLATSSQVTTDLFAADVVFNGGKATVDFYAPNSPSLTLTGTLTSAATIATAIQASTVSVTATGTTPSQDAIDAANEATDAANAATDAANAAAEAADAATAAAQDAQAAVAALATQVASLIAGIKAQITTLTNLVIKIQKKVRA